MWVLWRLAIVTLAVFLFVTVVLMDNVMNKLVGEMQLQDLIALCGRICAEFDRSYGVTVL